MNYVYKNKELKYYHEDPFKCLNFITDEAGVSYEVAKLNGWMILTQPIGTLDEYISLLNDYKLYANDIKTKKMYKMTFFCLWKNFNRLEMAYVNKYNLQYYKLYPELKKIC